MRQGDQFCQVHPGTPLQTSRATVKTKRGWKLVEVTVCAECDKLLDELRQTKATKDRYTK